MSAPPRPTIPILAELPRVLETSQLVLRPFALTDVDAVFPIVSQPEFPRMMSWAAHRDRDETAEHVRRLVEGGNAGMTWAITHDNQVIGSIALASIEWQVAAMRVDRGELGFWLAPAMWNKGFMTEAATAVVRFGFDTIGLHKITTECVVENAGSRRVIEKVGFRFVGRAEDDVWREGRWWTRLLYELTSPEWPDVHTTMRVSRPRPT
ncbi:MAG: GNAT family protein [Kofleriaceae bacterium]